MRYSPKPFETLLTRFIARQNKIIERLFSQFAYDAAALIVRANLPEGNEDFYFHDREALSRQVDVLLRGLSNRLTKTIQAGDEWGWELANAKNDNMLNKVLESIGRDRVPASALEKWSQKNLPALAAFENRRIGGMSLSDKVWAYTRGIKGDLELALDLGLASGTSADRLSRTIREFLIEPDRLYRRVRDEKGVLRLSKNAKLYHPGQGVYRSSYKNARRLAATETNMAYRTADNERMNQMDWILGFEVHLSNNHTCLNSKGVPEPFYDICDELQGKYPKWFIFKGWHPLCRCYVTTILPDKDEMIKYLAAMDENGHSSYKFKDEVTDVPPQFKQWVVDNTDRIDRAQERGKLPYFLKDNPKAWDTNTTGLSKRELTENERADIRKRAEERHRSRTPEQIRDIQDRWDARVYGDAYVENVHDIERRLGIMRGKRMTHEEANTGRVNPNYGKNGYSTNCSTCSAVYILRRMGFDVSAKSNWGQNLVFSLSQGETTWAKWKGGKATYTKTYDWMTAQGLSKMTDESWMQFLNEHTKAPGIYEFNLSWSPKSGHSTLIERTADGTLQWIEQQDRSKSPRSIKSLIAQCYHTPPQTTRGIMRVDNALFNPAWSDIARPNKGTKKLKRK